MTNEEKIALIEETLDIDSGSLSPETVLTSIAEYDSMAKLSLIVLCDETFSKKLSGEQIRAFNTVGDILAFLD
jgi:acyl carrier protein